MLVDDRLLPAASRLEPEDRSRHRAVAARSGGLVKQELSDRRIGLRRPDVDLVAKMFLQRRNRNADHGRDVFLRNAQHAMRSTVCRCSLVGSKRTPLPVLIASKLAGCWAIFAAMRLS